MLTDLQNFLLLKVHEICNNTYVVFFTKPWTCCRSTLRNSKFKFAGNIDKCEEKRWFNMHPFIAFYLLIIFLLINLVFSFCWMFVEIANVFSKFLSVPSRDAVRILTQITFFRRTWPVATEVTEQFRPQSGLLKARSVVQQQAYHSQVHNTWQPVAALAECMAWQGPERHWNLKVQLVWCGHLQICVRQMVDTFNNYTVSCITRNISFLWSVLHFKSYHL